MKLLAICFVLGIIIILYVIIESIREIRELNITEYNICHNKLPKEYIGYKLILMADLHNCFNNTEKILQVIDKENPNGVFIAGDMLVYGDDHSINNKKSLDLIKEISKHSDVYYAPGNHEMGYMLKKNREWIEYERYLLETTEDNIYFLDNKCIELERGNSSIKIYGLHLTDGYYKRLIKKELSQDTLNNLLGPANENDFKILIAHNPDYFNDYCEWGANVVLSGHNHGGLMRLPLLGGVISPRLRLFPKYDYGLFKNQEKILILSGGLGAHSLKIRVNNKPELVIVNLKKQ